MRIVVRSAAQAMHGPASNRTYRRARGEAPSPRLADTSPSQGASVAPIVDGHRAQEMLFRNTLLAHGDDHQSLTQDALGIKHGLVAAISIG